MFQTRSFISFHDLSPEANFLWASASVEDCLGWTPEELIGVTAYEHVLKDDLPFVHVTHQEHVFNDMAASQMVTRYRHKGGGCVIVSAVFSICYEFIVCCCTIMDADENTCRQIRSYSAAMTRIVEPRNQELNRIRRHHSAFKANGWSPDALDPEPRVCLILNRFTRDSRVMYASPACEHVLHIDADEMIDKPFLVFIRSDDLASFVEQVAVAKATSMITHMRFWFHSPNWPQEIPCEAVLFGSSDGLVVIMRRCRPFERRRFIAYQGYCEGCIQSAASSCDSRSSASTFLAHYNSVSLTPPSLSHTLKGRYCSIVKTPRGMPIGSIRRIIEQGSEGDLKPLAALQVEDPMEDLVTLPEERFIRSHHTQDISQDEVLIEEIDGESLDMDWEMQ